MAAEEFITGVRAAKALVEGASFDPVAILAEGKEAHTAEALSKVGIPITPETRALAADRTIVALPAAERLASIRGAVNPDIQESVTDPSGLQSYLFRRYGHPSTLGITGETGQTASKLAPTRDLPDISAEPVDLNEVLKGFGKREYDLDMLLSKGLITPSPQLRELAKQLRDIRASRVADSID